MHWGYQNRSWRACSVRRCWWWLSIFSESWWWFDDEHSVSFRNMWYLMSRDGLALDPLRHSYILLSASWVMLMEIDNQFLYVGLSSIFVNFVPLSETLKMISCQQSYSSKASAALQIYNYSMCTIWMDITSHDSWVTLGIILSRSLTEGVTDTLQCEGPISAVLNTFIRLDIYLEHWFIEPYAYSIYSMSWVIFMPLRREKLMVCHPTRVTNVQKL